MLDPIITKWDCVAAESH